MTEATRYSPGDFYRICDYTGFKVRASRTRKMWNGLIVRKESWEARHPQDFVRGVADYMVVPEARPRPGTKTIKIPVILTDSGLESGYGTPLYRTVDGYGDPMGRGYIYRTDGLGDNELPIVTQDSYPRSW